MEHPQRASKKRPPRRGLPLLVPEGGGPGRRAAPGARAVWPQIVLGLTVALLVVQLTGRLRFDPAALVLRLADLALVGGYLVCLIRLLLAQWRQGQPPALSRPHLALLAAVTLLGAAALGRSEGLYPSPLALSFLIKTVVLISSLLVSTRLRTRLAALAHLRRTPLSAPAIVVLSFVIAALLGWGLLSLPEATPPGRPVAPVDALFTATSAVCVTGLIVKDTPRDFSPFGLAVIAMLFQAGGLGIMTLSVLFAALQGRRFSLRERLVVQDTVIGREAGASTPAASLRTIVGFALLCEAIGAALLLGHWWQTGMPPGQALAQAGFHAVSAFCNAGFSLNSDNLMAYRTDVLVNLVVGALVIVGGLGFPVVLDIVRYLRGIRKRRRPRLALHSRMVLWCTLALVAGGALFLGLAEHHASQWQHPVGEQIMESWFQSVISRTAGFNTVNVAALREASLLALVVMMFIGGGSASTAGGIKTNTFVVLITNLVAMATSGGEARLWGRRVPEAVRHRAFAVASLMGLALLTLTTFLLLTHPAPLMEALFEAASALGTVGLSMGLTPSLTTVGRIAIILAMLLGRAGPLTLALAIRSRRQAELITYPEEEVLVG